MAEIYSLLCYNTETRPLKPLDRVQHRDSCLKEHFSYANSLNPALPHVVEGEESKIDVERQKVKSYHDQLAHPLPQLEVGQQVRVAPLKRGAGTLAEQLSERS